MNILYGVDPNETAELDLCLEAGRLNVEAWRTTLEALREEAAAVPAAATKEQRDAAAAKVAAVERRLAAAEADLAAYVPGSGPIFTVGHLPPARAVESDALAGDIVSTTDRKARALLDLEWQRLVARYAIRGHRQLHTRAGADLPYLAGPEETIDGRPRPTVSDATLELYATSRILHDLAILANRRARLDEAGKNA